MPCAQQVVAELVEKESQPTVPRSMLQQVVLGFCALLLCGYLLMCAIKLEWPFVRELVGAKADW